MSASGVPGAYTSKAGTMLKMVLGYLLECSPFSATLHRHFLMLNYLSRYVLRKKSI